MSAPDPEMAHLVRLDAARNAGAMAGDEHLGRIERPDVASLVHDAGKKERRQAAFRFFDRQDCQAGAPKLFLVEGAFGNGQAQRISFGFERRRRQGGVEQGALTVAQIGKRPFAASLIRMKRKFDMPDESFESVSHQPLDRRRIGVGFMDLRPALREALDDELCRRFALEALLNQPGSTPGRLGQQVRPFHSAPKAFLEQISDPICRIAIGRDIDELDSASIDGSDPLALVPVERGSKRNDPANVFYDCAVIRPGRLQANARLERLAWAGGRHLIEAIRHGIGGCVFTEIVSVGACLSGPS